MPTAAVPDETHAGFFAAVRRELEPERAPPNIVPRSFGAALLAGLVVGFCLAGLDVTRDTVGLGKLASATGADVSRLLPAMIVMGLLGGARAAATSLLIAHSLLRRTGHTSHAAYVLAGGLVAAGFAAAATALMQTGILDATMLPSHGLAIDTAAGGGAGLVYRVLAGSRPAG